MAIETAEELAAALIFACLYIAAAIYFIWVILPIWLREKVPSKKIAGDQGKD